MTLFARLQAVEQAMLRSGNQRPVVSVCERIDELTVQFKRQLSMFSPAVEAGILAAVEREERALTPT